MARTSRPFPWQRWLAKHRLQLGTIYYVEGGEELLLPSFYFIITGWSEECRFKMTALALRPKILGPLQVKILPEIMESLYLHGIIREVLGKEKTILNLKGLF